MTPTAERLEAYLAVENTYLTTFQALGGLGLLLGALGLAVVLLRSVWERRGELALLRALGYRQPGAGLAGAGGERLPAAAGPGARDGAGPAVGRAAAWPAAGGRAVAEPAGLLFALVLAVGLAAAAPAAWRPRCGRRWCRPCGGSEPC